MEINEIISIVIRPHFWNRNYKISAQYDKWLRDALRKPEITELKRHTCVLNGKDIWIANYPYAFGNLRWINLLPSRYAALMLRKELERIPEYPICEDLEQQVHEALESTTP